MKFRTIYKSAKIKRLEANLKRMKRVVVAFSGGLDSTFLLKMAIDVIGAENVLAVTAKSYTFPKREYDAAKRLAKKLGVTLETIRSKELNDALFLKNPINRCYYCKKELFSKIRRIAETKDFDYVVEGYNYDDRKDIRYGKRAADELGIKSPLADARIGKDDIRKFSKKLNLLTWEKPSFACLASRFPYYCRITNKGLRRVDKAEEFLIECGVGQVRVRIHNNVARIEVDKNDFPRIISMKDAITKKLKQLGFSYVTLDLEGYRTGSMNEPIRKNHPRKYLNG